MIPKDVVRLALAAVLPHAAFRAGEMSITAPRRGRMCVYTLEAVTAVSFATMVHEHAHPSRIDMARDAYRHAVLARELIPMQRCGVDCPCPKHTD